MNNILLCTDCSDNAKRAIDQCLFQFQNQPTNYTFLYTYFIEDTTVSSLVANNDALKVKVNNCLKAELSRIKKSPFAKNCTFTINAVFGKTENVVERILAKNKIDLVVVGNQGSNYSSHQLFGSTTKKLLYDLKCPKLVVPYELKASSLDKHIVIVQENEIQNRDWFSTITSFPKNRNLTFKLVIIPHSSGKKSSIFIPSFIEHQLLSVSDFSDKNFTTIHEPLQQIIKQEQPSVLHLHVNNQNAAKHILENKEFSKSICNSIPIFIQPFNS